MLVHCATGKDRTGILIAVLLHALEALDHAIVEDYAATEERLAPHFQAELDAIDDPARRSRVAERQHATARTMSGLIEHLVRRYDGGAAYLHRHGFDEGALARLARRLTG